jgi:hypothetical protein
MEANEFWRPVGRRPILRKLGTIDIDGAEATPFVHGGRLHRLESIHPAHHANTMGIHYFRIIDAQSRQAHPPFALGCEYGSAYVQDERVFVVGTFPGGGDKIKLFWSENLIDWKEKTILDLPGWGFYNTSVCRAGNRYIMAIEIDAPAERTGVPYTINFATSADLMDWALLTEDHIFGKDRYAACPALRYYDGFYYMVYLEALPIHRYVPYIARSEDLRTWAIGIFSPILCMDDRDKIIRYPGITPVQRRKLLQTADISNSDLDFCNWQGRTHILYLWGNQLGLHCMAEAEYNGSEQEMLESFFN